MNMILGRFVNTEIEIGKPDCGWGCTAVIVPGYANILSYNDVGYWCHLPYRIGAKIGKDSDGGFQIAEAIKAKVPEGAMQTIILGLLLPKLEPHDFIGIVEQARKDAARDARNSLRRELAAVFEEE